MSGTMKISETKMGELEAAAQEAAKRGLESQTAAKAFCGQMRAAVAQYLGIRADVPKCINPHVWEKLKDTNEDQPTVFEGESGETLQTLLMVPISQTVFFFPVTIRPNLKTQGHTAQIMDSDPVYYGGDGGMVPLCEHVYKAVKHYYDHTNAPENAVTITKRPAALGRPPTVMGR